MDAKRNPSPDFIESRSAQLNDSILAFEPDILIVSDDNALKYLVKSNLQDLAIPLVFCGVNRSDREYDLPANKVTGMLEILPLADLLLTMRPYYPSMQKLLVLSEEYDYIPKRKNNCLILCSVVSGFQHQMNWWIILISGSPYSKKQINCMTSFIYPPTEPSKDGTMMKRYVLLISI